MCGLAGGYLVGRKQELCLTPGKGLGEPWGKMCKAFNFLSCKFLPSPQTLVDSAATQGLRKEGLEKQGKAL